MFLSFLQKLQAKEAADQDEIERLKHALVRAEEAGSQRLPPKKVGCLAGPLNKQVF